MINISLKPCCLTCNNAVVTGEQERIDSLYNKTHITVIGCTHMTVCKYYLESADSTISRGGYKGRIEHE